jgi:hypothetical protein
LGFAIIAGLFCLGIWQDNYIPFIISVLLYIPTLLIICIASCIHWVCRKGPEPGLRLPVQESQGGTPNNVLPFIRATREERNRVMALQGHKCANPYCNMDLRGGAPHWDHIVPRARGGTDSLHNMQWLCDGCNLSKSAQDWPVFLTQYAAGLGITPDVNSVPIQRWFAMRQKVCRY